MQRFGGDLGIASQELDDSAADRQRVGNLALQRQAILSNRLRRPGHPFVRLSDALPINREERNPALLGVGTARIRQTPQTCG